MLPTRFRYEGKRAIPIYDTTDCLLIVNDSCKRAVQFIIDQHSLFGNAVRRHEWQNKLRVCIEDASGRDYWIMHGKLWIQQINALYNDSDILKLMIAGWVRFWVIGDQNISMIFKELNLSRLDPTEYIKKLQDNW